VVSRCFKLKSPAEITHSFFQINQLAQFHLLELNVRDLCQGHSNRSQQEVNHVSPERRLSMLNISEVRGTGHRETQPSL